TLGILIPAEGRCPTKRQLKQIRETHRVARNDTNGNLCQPLKSLCTKLLAPRLDIEPRNRTNGHVGRHRPHRASQLLMSLLQDTAAPVHHLLDDEIRDVKLRTSGASRRCQLG